ncbi:MAG: TonB-dependent receptor [Puia sp.]|nr:TonB-dependent receptor [Puia sp.]
MKHLFITFILILFFSTIQVFFCTIQAQQQSQVLQARPTVTGKSVLKGRILDSLSRSPVEYASVTLYAKKGAPAINGTVSGSKGSFALEGLPAGSWLVSIEAIGYGTKTIGPVTVGSKTPTVSLGDIFLTKKAADLQAVTVVAPRGLIENKIDKMVYNAEKDITSQGGVATDILKKVPMVSVDVDGNVELQGNANILFLINGRPSSIFGNNLADALQSIPASQIKSIEVITSPGAKYDAEGTGGIINIVLKDNKLSGINSNISLTGGSRLENGSFNLNARKNNFGISAFFSGNAQLPSTTLTTATRRSFDSTGNLTDLLQQNGSGRFHRNGYESGLGLDWSLDKHDNLSANIGYDHFGNNNRGAYQQQETQYGTPPGSVLSDIYSLVQSHNQFRAQSLDWNLRYKKTYAQEDRELDISVDGSFGKNNASYGQVQSLPSGDSVYSGSQGNSTGHDRETNFRLDYVHPLGEGIKLETGGRIQDRRISSTSPYYALEATSGSYIYDTSQSNSLTYNRDVYAGYASLTFPAFHFLDVKAGLRYERTETNAGFSKSPGTLIPGYNTFAPSVTLLHNLGDEQSIKISYTRRIQRPDYRGLNPYVNATDPKNLTRGNPFLQPEVADNIDLTYAKSFAEGSALNIVLFYHRSGHDIQPFIEYYPEFTIGDSVYRNVSVNTPMNVGSENNYGMNIYGSIPVGKKINLRSNLSLFDRYITTGTLGGSSITSFNYRINLNATYQATPNFVLEFFGNFNSARNEIQGRYPFFTSYNLAARKQFWKKKVSIAFTTTNPFALYVRQATELAGTNFTLDNVRQIPYRSFGINITYKFGKLEFKKDKEENRELPVTPDN